MSQPPFFDTLRGSLCRAPLSQSNVGGARGSASCGRSLWARGHEGVGGGAARAGVAGRASRADAVGMGAGGAPGIERRDGDVAAERAILAEVVAMRTILLNFMLKVGEGTPMCASLPG